MTTEVIKVDGMSCKHCKMAVENTVKKIDGVTHAEVNLDEGNITISYDESTTNKNKVIDSINATETYQAHV